ncbi:MAG: hypothetical protein QM608_13820 [Caulobacter sp.]
MANTWTLIEGHIAYALGAMIGADPRVSLAILSKVQTATAKSQMIRAIAKAALDEQFRPDFEKLMKTFDAMAPRRNKVIHGLWGVMDVEPDCLIWVPSDLPTRISLGMLSAMVAGNSREFLNDSQSENEIWEAADFDALNSDLSELASLSVSFATKMHAFDIAGKSGVKLP